MTNSETIRNAGRELAAELSAHIAADGQHHRDALTAYQDAAVLLGRNQERAEILAYVKRRWDSIIGTSWLVEALENGEHRS